MRRPACGDRHVNRHVNCHAESRMRCYRCGWNETEMERDAMIGHGMSQFLKERFMECSDLYTMRVCNKCGLIARKQMNKESYICDGCKNASDISKVCVPYAYKLLTQQLMAINIVPRIKTEQSEFNYMA